jgi:hypothetical protein
LVFCPRLKLHLRCLRKFTISLKTLNSVHVFQGCLPFFLQKCSQMSNLFWNCPLCTLRPTVKMYTRTLNRASFKLFCELFCHDGQPVNVLKPSSLPCRLFSCYGWPQYKHPRLIMEDGKPSSHRTSTPTQRMPSEQTQHDVVE